MTTTTAGTRVRRGYWFNVNSWTLHPVASDGETLPGAASERYIHVPLLAAFALAPLMGAAFLMFLPFVGFYLAANALVRPVVRAFHSSATEVAATIAPTWAPGEAHLTGGRAESEPAEANGPPAVKGELSELEREVEARRAERK
jgi:hypothetical protein